MTKLTTLQLALLEEIAKAAGGVIQATSADKRTIVALKNRGFIVALSVAGLEVGLQITVAGRAAIDGGEGTANEPSVPNSGNADEALLLTKIDEPAPSTASKLDGKIGMLVNLLRRPDGATIEELMSATGWQAHSVRGAMSGALKKRRGFAATSQKTDGARIYRLPAEGAA